MSLYFLRKNITVQMACIKHFLLTTDHLLPWGIDAKGWPDPKWKLSWARNADKLAHVSGQFTVC